MGKSHAAKSYPIPISELEVRKNELSDVERARRLLSQAAIPLKTWAYRLVVTERCAQMWASGEKEIPPKRIVQIEEVGAVLLLEQRDLIDQMIDELLLMKFGKQDPGAY